MKKTLIGCKICANDVEIQEHALPWYKLGYRLEFIAYEGKTLVLAYKEVESA